MFRLTQAPFLASVLLAVLSYSSLASPMAGRDVLERAVKYNYKTYTSTQRLDIPFQAPGRKPCSAAVTVQPDTDPITNGIGIVGLAPPPTTVGFPTINVTVSSPESKGYAAFYGWVQVLTYTKEPLPSDLSKATWAPDAPPILADSNIPFLALGGEPTWFDAPFYPYKSLDWTARAFLCYIPDGLVTKHPRPLIALQWGFVIEDHKPRVKQVQHVDTTTWNDHVDLLSKSFKGWTFTPEK